jgi:hypothetical protein
VENKKMEPSSTARLRLIALVLSAGASCVDAPPIDMGHERAEDSELPYIAVSDVGFDDLPHDYVDVARSPDKDMPGSELKPYCASARAAEASAAHAGAILATL